MAIEEAVPSFCVHGRCPEIAGLAQEIYRMRFSHAERNAMK